MTTSRLFEMIKGLTEQEVRADLARIQAARERLETEEMLLRQVLDLLPRRAPAAPPSNPTADDEPSDTRTRHDSAEGVGTPVRPPAPQAGKQPTSKRGPIKLVMASERGRMWTAAELRAALAQRGHDLSASNMRVTLRRMANRGEITKVADGQYTLPPSDNGSPQGTLEEANQE